MVRLILSQVEGKLFVSRIRAVVIVAVSLGLWSGRAAAQESAEIRRFTDRADSLAAEVVGVVGDLRWFADRYCHPTNEPGSAAAERRLWQSMVIPPTPVFDNLYYVGHGQYGAWVVPSLGMTTSIGTAGDLVARSSRIGRAL